MGEDAGRGLECQKTMDGKVSNGNGSEKAIPSCCLKAIASDPEAEAVCHSTVVSGWFSESQSRTGHYLISLNFPLSHQQSNSLVGCPSRLMSFTLFMFFFYLNCR